VANRGGSVATGVRLALALPGASTIQRSSADRGACRAQAESVTCELGPLLPGEAATVVVETRAAAGNSEATAEVTLDQRDSNLEDNRASLRIRVGPVTRATAAVASLKLTPVQPAKAKLHRGRNEITTGFTLNRRARVTVTLLAVTGRRIPLLAGSSIGGFRSKKTNGTLARSLAAGRSMVILRYRELSQRKPSKVKLVARDSTGERVTLLTVRR